ncbi:hypothetical protein Tco_1448258 [Tanacetum coccineum]
MLMASSKVLRTIDWEYTVTFPSMLCGSPPMNASISFSEFGTMFGHKISLGLVLPIGNFRKLPIGKPAVPFRAEEIAPHYISMPNGIQIYGCGAVPWRWSRDMAMIHEDGDLIDAMVKN